MRIGIFGGAFDPPHMGHLLAATYFLACDPQARLLIVPSLRHPWDKQMAPYATRLAWCRTLAKLLGPRARVSTIEEAIKGTGRTLLVVRALRKKFPKATFSIVVGADAYAGRAKWFEIENLERESEWFVLGRGDAQADHLSIPEVSSHAIRARLAAGDTCAGLVPEVILAQVLESRAYSSATSAGVSVGALPQSALHTKRRRPARQKLARQAKPAPHGAVPKSSRRRVRPDRSTP